MISKVLTNFCKTLIYKRYFADKAFDATWLVQRLQSTNCQVVIAQKANRRAPLLMDREMYKWRHLIETTFASSKNSSVLLCVATKTDSSFAAVVPGICGDQFPLILNRP